MKILRLIISPVFMGILLLIFAVSMAVATFIENDFGSLTAYIRIYNSIWFELILLLLAVNLVGQVFEFRLYRREKLTIFIFHLAFVLILTGAAITRYTGSEGVIHIREGETQSSYFSSEKYIGYNIKGPGGEKLAGDMMKFNLSSTGDDNYNNEAEAGDQKFEIRLARVIPNAQETIVESESGFPVISLMAATGSMHMENISLKKGESAVAAGYTIGFDSEGSTDIAITADFSGFYITSDSGFSETGMMHGDGINYNPGDPAGLKTMRIYDMGRIKIIPQVMTMNGIMKPSAVDPEDAVTGQNALIFNVFSGDKSAALTLWDKDGEYMASGNVQLGNKTVEVFYGSKINDLPFTLTLHDFILERYPGSDSPSGYKSDVILKDDSRGVEMPFLIFMNNILKYRGYRFYQSSFDRDEKGTVLSVNRDMPGMTVTYTGYAIMALFIILSLVNKRSVFRTVKPGFWSSPFIKTLAVTVLLASLAGSGSLSAQKLTPDRKLSGEIGKILVQDQKGRTKPLYTISNDILRKIARENEFEGLSSMQVFLGIYLDFGNWQKVKMIRVSSNELGKKIGIRGKMASFDDIVDIEGGGVYKLSESVKMAYEKAPGDRDKFDKEVMKVDERVNILYMIYTGQFMKMFPLKTPTHEWGTSDEALKNAVSREDSLYLGNITGLLSEALRENNSSNAVRIAGSISEYQKRFSEYDLPSGLRVNAEVFYYKAKIFERLFPFYAMLGMVMLILLIYNVIKGAKGTQAVVKITGWILFAGFLFHTLGLALRWFISGHSPMSNGYESMIFISWVTLLAGFIFNRKSPFALSATALLGSMTLMVAHLSFMDPEITNLVPVLKSYWLTLHVSVITGSYGFLGLGAILGIINMILLALSSRKNIEKIGKTIGDLTVINFRSLTLGLYFLTIGTFLGAVWANESWGRYWGWDPKETWSLITIVVYTLVIHSRLIPGMKDIYTFNLLSLFAFSSVIMTYFGVNYYLSGLHSYAGGDPVPVPVFVYIVIILLGTVSLLGYFRYSTLKKEAEDGK